MLKFKKKKYLNSLLFFADMNKIDIETMSQEMIRAQKEIDQYLDPNKNIDKVIFLGITGAGKTTLSCLLTGNKIMIRPYKKSKVTLEFTGTHIKCGKITTIPNIWTNPDKDLLIADCPGFRDVKGTVQEIINSFAIDHLLDSFAHNYNRIKILLVVSAHEIQGGRAQLCFENFERIEKMFPDQKQIENGIGIIITKSDPGTDPSDYIDELMEDAPDIVIKWCNFFIDHPEKIFTLPQPSKDDVNKEYIYNDKEKLLHFLKTQQIENAIHNIALSKSATDDVRTMKFKRNKQLDSKIADLFDSMYDIYNKEKDLSELNRWSDLLLKFSKLEIRNTSDLIKIIQSYLPNDDIFSEYISYLKEFESFDSFISKVFRDNEKASKIQKIFRNKTNDAIVKLGTIQQNAYLIDLQNKQIQDKEQMISKQEKMISETKKSAEEYREKMEQKFEKQEKAMEAKEQEMHQKLEKQEKAMEAEKQEMAQKLAKQEKETQERLAKQEKATLERLEKQRKETEERLERKDREIREMQSKHMEEINELRKKMKFMNGKARPSIVNSDLSYQQIYSGTHISDEELGGIFKVLSDEVNGNIHEKGIIQITSNSINNQYYLPKYAVDFRSKDYYCSHGDDDAYICFDLISLKIQVDSYFIKSPISKENDFLRNWVIEVSNNKANWIIIDKRNNCNALNSNGAMCVFNIPQVLDGFYRYIRLRSTGLGWGIEKYQYLMSICYIDFYGVIWPPKMI